MVRAVCTSVDDRVRNIRHPERAQRRGISGWSNASHLPEGPPVGKPPLGMTVFFHPSRVCAPPHVKTRDDVWCPSSPTQLQPVLATPLAGSAKRVVALGTGAKRCYFAPWSIRVVTHFGPHS